MSFPESPQPGPTPAAAPAPPAPPAAPPVEVASPAFRGSFRLLRVAGTDVFVHWTWFVAAFLLTQGQPGSYSSLAWGAGEYVAGFVLVLLHEFGHVLACRSVGGAADRVVLWPLGGLAFVAPPPRPGATLWAIAAGPLVNLALAPALILLAVLTDPGVGLNAPAELNHLFTALAWFNAFMLGFNLLPVFPLDGGRILQAALWRWLGRSASLAVAAGVGLVCAAGLGVVAAWLGEVWLGVVAGFLVLGALGGLSHAHLVARLGRAERREGLSCPNCGAAPPLGDFWRCSRCMRWFDLFAPAGGCPKGRGHTTDGACPECGRQLGLSEWVTSASAEPDAAPPSGQDAVL